MGSTFDVVAMRFTKIPGDIVWYKDEVTGLCWSESSVERMNFADADTWCSDVGGRMPSIDELLSVVDRFMYGPCTALPSTFSNFYWSSSVYAVDKQSRWVVYFNDGNTFIPSASSLAYVRAVKGEFK